MKHRVQYPLIALCISILIGLFVGCGTEIRGQIIQLQTNPKAINELYDHSYALVIGNDHYASSQWGRLQNAVKDAREVARALEKHGFEVTLKLNQTGKQFRDAFIAFFNQYGGRAKNRLVFYFAGHGHAIDHPYKAHRKIGYLVMTDAPHPDEDLNGFERNSVELEFIERKANRVRAHHVLFLFDSCFSGSIFDAMRGAQKIAPPIHIYEDVKHPVRQFISAGQAREAVPDESVFKKCFLNLINGEHPEAARDGYLTGTELAFYLRRDVIAATHNVQHPQYAKSRDPDLNKGDFIFVLDSAASYRGKTERPKCTRTVTKYPPVFPHSLLNSMTSGDFPYWFYVQLQNDCDETLLFDVAYDLLSGPGVIAAEKKIPYKVAPGRKFAQSVPFPIEFVKEDIDDVLIVTWTIRDNANQRLLDQGTAQIVVYPKTRYCWNLTNYNGAPVSQDYLFAALTAWAQSADSHIKAMTHKLVRKIDRQAPRAIRAQNWMELCYALFHDHDDYIEITPFKDRFPPRKCWDILTPMTVFKERYGDPIEASLLIGSLSNKARVYKRLGMRLAFFIAPGRRTSQYLQDYYIGWKIDGQEWRALNMSYANDQSFQDNERRSSQRIARLLSANPHIVDALDAKGVYIDKQAATFAIDFAQAARRFRIRALP